MDTKPITPLVLTLAQAAEALSVSPQTVRRLLVAGDLAPVRVRRSLRVSTASLHAYIARQTTGSDNGTDGVAVQQEDSTCQDERSEIKTVSTNGNVHRTGGRRSRTDAAAQLAALLELPLPTTRAG